MNCNYPVVMIATLIASVCGFGCSQKTLPTPHTESSNALTETSSEKVPPSEAAALAVLKTCLDSWTFGDKSEDFKSRHPKLSFTNNIDLWSEHPILHKYEISASRKLSDDGATRTEYQFVVALSFLDNRGRLVNTSNKYKVSSTGDSKWDVWGIG